MEKFRNIENVYAMEKFRNIENVFYVLRITNPVSNTGDKQSFKFITNYYMRTCVSNMGLISVQFLNCFKGF